MANVVLVTVEHLNAEGLSNEPQAAGSGVPAAVSPVHQDLDSATLSGHLEGDQVPRQLHSRTQELPIPDGGGASSTAGWLQPRVSDDLFRGLRRKFEALAMEWGAVPRVFARMRDPSDQSIF